MRFPGQRIKILVRRNLKMSGGKIAAQSVHATLALASLLAASPDDLMEMAYLTTVTLDASDQKFRLAKEKLDADGVTCYAFEDSGYTEVEPKTVTVLAFLEPDPKVEDGIRTEPDPS